MGEQLQCLPILLQNAPVFHTATINFFSDFKSPLIPTRACLRVAGAPILSLEWWHSSWITFHQGNYIDVLLNLKLSAATMAAGKNYMIRILDTTESRANVYQVSCSTWNSTTKSSTIIRLWSYVRIFMSILWCQSIPLHDFIGKLYITTVVAMKLVTLL